MATLTESTADSPMTWVRCYWYGVNELCLIKIMGIFLFTYKEKCSDLPHHSAVGSSLHAVPASPGCALQGLDLSLRNG